MSSQLHKDMIKYQVSPLELRSYTKKFGGFVYSEISTSILDPNTYTVAFFIVHVVLYASVDEAEPSQQFVQLWPINSGIQIFLALRVSCVTSSKLYHLFSLLLSYF